MHPKSRLPIQDCDDTPRWSMIGRAKSFKIEPNRIKSTYLVWMICWRSLFAEKLVGVTSVTKCPLSPKASNVGIIPTSQRHALGAQWRRKRILAALIIINGLADNDIDGNETASLFHFYNSKTEISLSSECHVYRPLLGRL